MNRIFGMAAGIALLAGGVLAQDEAGRKMKLELERISTAVAPLHAGIGETVKGAPFSGQEIRESNQVLADGTRIHNESKTQVYRDSEGRMRRENGDQITINDPAAGTTYLIDNKAMTAVKLPAINHFYVRQGPMPAGGAVSGMIAAGVPKGNISVKDNMVTVERDGKPETFPLPPSGEWTSPDGKMHVVSRGSAAEGSGTAHIGAIRVMEGSMTVAHDGQSTTMPLPPDKLMAEKLSAEAGVMAVPAMRVRMPAGKSEDLGEQAVEGVKARGTRTTFTIETGAVGNDRPLTTVMESWYSDELKMEVSSRRSDPRSGDSTFRLTDINRGEPAPYLFQVPSGYSVTERK